MDFRFSPLGAPGNPPPKPQSKFRVTKATEFVNVMAAVSLAQNFAALRALASEGIQRVHMKLHSQNVAVAVGASKGYVDLVAQKMIEERKVGMDKAKEILTELQGKE